MEQIGNLVVRKGHNKMEWKTYFFLFQQKCIDIVH